MHEESAFAEKSEDPAGEGGDVAVVFDRLDLHRPARPAIRALGEFGACVTRRDGCGGAVGVRRVGRGRLVNLRRRPWERRRPRRHL